MHPAVTRRHLQHVETGRNVFHENLIHTKKKTFGRKFHPHRNKQEVNPKEENAVSVVIQQGTWVC
jgi:hypothetical protein